MRGLICALLALSVAACEPPTRGVTVTIRPAQAEACRPGEVLRVDFQPLADTPLAERPRQSLDLMSPTAAQTLEPFAPETRAVAVSAQARETWVGGGIVLLDLPADELAVPMLPFDAWCGQSDPDLRLRDGAAWAALHDGRFVIAGGDTTEIASDEVLLVSPGEPIADRASIRLNRERTRASATWVRDGLVVVAGGTIGGDQGVRDTFDLLDLEAGTVDTFDLLEGRFDHAAARLRDGSILLVGGLRAEMDPLPNAERVTLSDGVPEVVPAGSAVGRASPEALALDDGSVVVAGGHVAGAPARAIERWDGASLVSVGEWDARPDAAYVALAGGRAAMVGGRDDAGEWLGRVVLLLADDTLVVVDDAMAPVASPRALGLPDGQLLVVGADPDSGVRVTQRVDPGGTRAALDVSIATARPNDVPAGLLALADGSIVAADAIGVELLRLDLSSSFDDLPDAIDPGQSLQQEQLSFDAPGRLSAAPPPGAVRGPLYAAVNRARFDLPRVRFGALRLEVDLVGDGEILLTRDGQPPLVVSVEDERVRFDGCEVARRGDDPIVLVRQGGSVELRVGDDATSCEVPQDERFGVAVRLSEGSGVQQISATR